MRKTKYYLSLNAAERQLAVHAMLHFRNKAISLGVDTVDIEKLIQKLQCKRRWF